MYKYILIGAFLFFEVLSFVVLKNDKNSRIENRLTQVLEASNKQYSNIYNAYKKQTQIVFDEVVDTKEVKSILEALKETQDEEKVDEIREKLYEYLKPAYSRLVYRHIRQLHFHLPNNQSFLRMFHADTYGDDLTQLRPTVVKVNTYHKAVDSFEVGHVFSGYRFVYPLYSRNDIYLGSVEISLSPVSISTFMQEYNFDAHVLIKKSVFDAKVLQEEKMMYKVSDSNSHYVVDKKEFSKGTEHQHLLKNREYLALIQQNMAKGKAFAAYATHNNKTIIASFLPIINSVTKEQVGYFALYTNSAYIKDRSFTFWITFMLLTLLNISVVSHLYSRKRNEETLKVQLDEIDLSHKRLDAIINGVDNMLMVMHENEVVMANTQFLDFVGCQKEGDIEAKHVRFEDYIVYDEPIKSTSEGIKAYTTLAFLRQLDEQAITVTLKSSNNDQYAFTVNVNEYDLEQYVVTFTDVTNLVDAKNKYKFKAHHDYLTGVNNRQYFVEELTESSQQLSRSKDTVCLVMIDIDFFKKVNDTYGHDIGDRVLQIFSGLIKKSIRSDDLLARWGGEEFMILLPHTTLDNGLKKINEVREVIASYRDDEIPPITASFGLTQLKVGENVDVAVKRVDEALYFAKENGRNRVEVL